jgi:hypothetical protein
MFAAGVAVTLAIALVLEVTGHGRAVSGVFAAAGLVFMALAVMFPSRPRFPRRSHVSHEPHYGHTRHGMAVHARTIDHHPAGSAYARFNKRVALALTAGVGTMTTFWVFCLLALCSLPSVLSAFAPFASTFPHWMVKASIIALVAWIAQTLIQLVLLPALMVGQNLQNEAADARTAKTFEDVEAVRADLTTALDRLDLETGGGLAVILAEVKAAHDDVKALRDILGTALGDSAKARKAAPKRLATEADRSEGAGK